MSIFGRDFCADCYGYDTVFRQMEEDLKQYTIEEMKHIYKSKTCALCGKTTNVIQRKLVADCIICSECEKRIRANYPIEKDTPDVIVNMVAAGISHMTESPDLLFDIEQRGSYLKCNCRRAQHFLLIGLKRLTTVRFC